MNLKLEKILTTALSLFATHGYHSVGVDRIRDEAGISKMTLYKYFPTKEALIEGVLQRRDEQFRTSLEQAVAKATGCRDKIRAVFAWHDEWFRREEFHGCMFIKASEEFPEDDSPIRHAAKHHKACIRQLLLTLLEEGGAREAEQLSTYLLVMLEGLIVNANMFADRSCVDACWPYVEDLLDRHLQ